MSSVVLVVGFVAVFIVQYVLAVGGALEKVKRGWLSKGSELVMSPVGFDTSCSRALFLGWSWPCSSIRWKVGFGQGELPNIKIVCRITFGVGIFLVEKLPHLRRVDLLAVPIGRD